MNIKNQIQLSEWMRNLELPKDFRIMGIELGGSKIQAICLSSEGKFLIHRRALAKAEHGAAGIRETLLQLIREIEKSAGTFSLIGVGFGGLVDWRSGTTKASFQVRGWEDFPLAEWISNQCGGAEVVVENDTNSAAFAESMIGSGFNHSHVLYSNSGSGVGAGYVVHREIFRGSSFFEMELGHLRVGEYLQPLQNLCSGWSIDERIRQHIEAEPESEFSQLLLSQRPSHGFWGKVFDDSVSQNNPDAIRILNEVARVYALGLSHATYLLGPSVIVLGGGVSLMGEVWCSTISNHLDDFVQAPFSTSIPQIKLSALGELVVPLGAALLAIKRHQKTISQSVICN